MAVTLHETWDSRQVKFGANGGGEVLRYVALGSTDQVEVFNAIVAGTSATWDGFIRSDIRFDSLGGSAWKVEVEYAPFGLGGGDSPLGVTPPIPTAPGGDGLGVGDGTGTGGGGTGAGGGNVPLGPGYSIDISAETVHITQSVRTRARILPGAEADGGTNLTAAAGGLGSGAVNPLPTIVDPADVGKTFYIGPGFGWTAGWYTITSVDVPNNLWNLSSVPAAPGTTGGTWSMPQQAPDLKGAIGVTGGNPPKVEGCDVWGPKFEWTRVVSREIVTRDYIRVLRNLVGKKNAAPFYGSDIGEVLYLGASGTYTDSDKWSITHKFGENANQYDIEVTDTLTIPFKGGWDYIWFTYAPDTDQAGADATRVIQRPTAAYIEEVVEAGDFTGIEIGY